MQGAPTRKQQTAHAIRILRSLTPNARRRKIPKKQWPTAVERDYATTLREMTVYATAPAIAAIVDQVPRLIAATKATHHLDSASRVDEMIRTDAGEVKAIVDAAYKQIQSRLVVADIANAAHKFANQVSAHAMKQLQRQLQAAFGIPLSIPDTRTPRTIDAFIDQNVALVLDNVERLVGNIEKDFTRMLASSRLDAAQPLGAVRAGVQSRVTKVAQSIQAASNVRLIVRRPSDFDAQQLAAAIQRNVAMGGSTRELAKEIEDRFSFAEDHAEMIARDQVGKLNGQLNAQRSQSLGVTRFTWVTVGDENVRDEHEERDGEVYDYDNPPDGELPGEPINCRCSDEPILDDVIEPGDEED